MTASPGGEVSGVVSSAIGPVANATLSLEGTPIPATTTDVDGGYSFAAVPVGSYRVTVTGGGCFTAATSELVVDGDETLDRPAGSSPHVQRSLGSAVWRYRTTARVHSPVVEVAAKLPRRVTVEAVDEHTCLAHVGSDSPQTLALWLGASTRTSRSAIRRSWLTSC